MTEHNATSQIFSVAGRVALVTGGSMSIGRAIVEALADAGADIAINYSPEADAALGDADAAEVTAERVRNKGRQVRLIPADFNRLGEAARVVQTADEAFNRIDILVHCASVQYRRDFDALVWREVNHQINVNFLSSIELFKAALPIMRRQHWGRILSIGSVNQVLPEPELAVYAALKSAQQNIVINLAKQNALHGVTVNGISPGMIATQRNKSRRVDGALWKRLERECCPMQRAGKPEEIVGAALLLCSEAGSYITGTDLQITGGRHL